MEEKMKISFNSNKRANIPIIILVLGVLVICSLAILSFFSANFIVSNSFDGISEVENLNSQIELNLYEGKSVNGLFREKMSSTWNPFDEEKIIFKVEYKS